MTSTDVTARARLRGVAAAGGLALLLAGCGGSSTAKVANAGSSAAAPSSPMAPAGTKVTVTETEFKIALPQMSFTPGTYTFMVVDKGHATHALTIDGPGLSDRSSSTVNGGGSTSLTVTLQKGSYRLYCPVGGHAGLGMDTTIAVS